MKAGIFLQWERPSPSAGEIFQPKVFLPGDRKSRLALRSSQTFTFRPGFQKNSSAKQSTIDQFMFEAKNGPGSPTEPSHYLKPDVAGVQLELTTLRNELAILGDALIRDIILVATHPEIQTLDIAIQRIDRLLSLTK